MAENQRQQRIIERMQEDERLRGDLEDDAATPLLTWAAERAAAAAADPARPDDAVEADVGAVRAAVRAAANSGETEPARVLALAQSELQKHLPQDKGASPPGASPSETPTGAGTVAEAPAGHPPEDATPSVPIETDCFAEVAARISPARQEHRREAVETVARLKHKRSRLAGFLKRVRGRR